MKKEVTMTAIAALMTMSAMAATPTTVVEKTNAMETIVYGNTQAGAVIDRINQLSDTVYGKNTTGNLVDRVNQLYTSVEGEGDSVSLRQEVDVLEYTYQNHVTEGSLLARLDRLERSVSGSVSTGSINSRIQALQVKINGSHTKLTHQIGTVPADHVFQVTLREPVSTKLNHVGDTISFEMGEDLMDGDILLVPAGTVGVATVESLQKSRSFGRNGSLTMSFDIPAMDGTHIMGVQGPEAQEKTKGELKAAGASVAGAVLLGPVGLVGGLFVKGKPIEWPEGTTIYIQPQDVVTVQGVVIGGDGRDHSKDLTKAVEAALPQETSSPKEEPVTDAIQGGETAEVSASTDEVQEDTTSDNGVSEPIVVVKRD